MSDQREKIKVTPLAESKNSISHTHSQGRITVVDHRRTRVIEIKDIQWIAAAGDYVELHLHSAMHLLREPFYALLKRLPVDIFYRIHRSYAVNLNEISAFTTLRNQDLLVELKDGKVLRASRTFSESFKEALVQ